MREQQVSKEPACVQPFHPSQRYESPADRSVVSMTSEDTGLWGPNKLSRLYKESACMLHAPGALGACDQHALTPHCCTLTRGANAAGCLAGGPGNSRPLLDVAVPKYKIGQSLLWESTETAPAKGRGAAA